MYTCNCTVVWGPMPYIQEQVEPFLGLDVIALTAVCVIWRFLLHCRLHYSSVYYTVITMKLCESGIFVSHVIPTDLNVAWLNKFVSSKYLLFLWFCNIMQSHISNLWFKSKKLQNVFVLFYALTDYINSFKCFKFKFLNL